MELDADVVSLSLSSAGTELDKSYVTLYKRATAYLSMGRTGAALDDFDSILELNPSFAKVRLDTPSGLGSSSAGR